MSPREKIFSILALCYVTGFAALLLAVPSTREAKMLLPLALLGVAGNVGLLFVVFKDIFSRRFPRPATRFLWLVLIFLFLPAVLIYLPRHGFRKR